jgi:hypothetical protein
MIEVVEMKNYLTLVEDVVVEVGVVFGQDHYGFLFHHIQVTSFVQLMAAFEYLQNLVEHNFHQKIDLSLVQILMAHHHHRHLHQNIQDFVNDMLISELMDIEQIEYLLLLNILKVDLKNLDQIVLQMADDILNVVDVVGIAEMKLVVHRLLLLLQNLVEFDMLNVRLKGLENVPFDIDHLVAVQDVGTGQALIQDNVQNMMDIELLNRIQFHPQQLGHFLVFHYLLEMEILNVNAHVKVVESHQKVLQNLHHDNFFEYLVVVVDFDFDVVEYDNVADELLKKNYKVIVEVDGAKKREEKIFLIIIGCIKNC